MKQISFLLLFAFVNMTMAQHRTHAKLAAIDQDGLHEIKIPHTIRSFSNTDLSDFRIFDSKQEEVPYFIRRKRSYTATNEFIAFKINSKTMVKDSSSTIIFENPYERINKFVISLANYDGAKTFKLSGSDNLSEWFGLDNQQTISNLQNTSKTTIDKTVSFPLSSYRYLKIEFNDRNSLPINVLKIGSSSSVIESQELNDISIQSMKISELSEQQKTQIHIIFKNKEYLDFINFKITEPQRYKRQVHIYKNALRTVKKQEESYQQTLARFELNSTNDNTFELNELFENELFIEIENADNPMLEVSDLFFLQKPIYVIADLKKKERYEIKTEDKNLKAPRYDLSFFESTIADNLPKTAIIGMTRDVVAQKEDTPLSLWQQPWFMWVCISIAAIAILYFTSGLIKDLKKK